MKHKKLAVLDSCVVLTFLFGEPEGTADAEEKNHRAKQEIRQLIAEGHQIGLPAIVPTEVTSSKHAEKKGWPVAGERYGKFMNFLNDSEGLLILEVDVGIAWRASELAAEGPMKAGDALILASALAHKAEILVSWDDNLLKKAEKFEQDAREPQVRGQEVLFS